MEAVEVEFTRHNGQHTSASHCYQCVHAEICKRVNAIKAFTALEDVFTITFKCRWYKEEKD
jgi:hypothetical protein